jgi:hypothetical protein
MRPRIRIRQCDHESAKVQPINRPDPKLARNTTINRQLLRRLCRNNGFYEAANPAPSTSNAVPVGDAAFRRKPDKFGASHGDLHRHSSGSSGIAVNNGMPCIWRVLGREGVAGRSAEGRERGKPIVSRVNAITLLRARRIVAYDDRNHPVLCLGLFIGSGYVR